MPDAPTRPDDPPAPPVATLERWAWDYLAGATLAARFELVPPPPGSEPDAPARPWVRPTRPAGLAVCARAPKTPTPGALVDPARRAQLAHTFLHHELQAAELMCWAVLAFPGAPAAFRRGLAAIARDEVRHMGLYRAYLADLGVAFGALPVRDWFWDRVPSAPSPAHFVATLGVGLEGANLDHTLRFAGHFRSVGDRAGAALQEQVFDEEVPHVRFALHWFRAWTGRDDFGAWREHLVPPLSPLVMRGLPLERAGRLRAGLSPGFVEELSRWHDRGPGS